MEYLIELTVFLYSSVVLVSCDQTYTALNNIVFTNIEPVEDNVHSEYFYGKCATRKKTLAVHDHLTYEQIKGHLIVRGYLNATKPITCIYLRSSSRYADMIRYRTNRFTMCLSRIRYHYLGNLFDYYFYEWFLPVEMKKGIDWDLFFFYLDSD